MGYLDELAHGPAFPIYRAQWARLFPEIKTSQFSTDCPVDGGAQTLCWATKFENSPAKFKRVTILESF